MRYLRNIFDRAWDLSVVGLKYAALMAVGFFFLSHNGCLDSRRTKQTRWLHSSDNLVKSVANVDESWRDNSEIAMLTCVFGGGGYNPQVIRTITFEDGTETTVKYRTLAHQPFRRWGGGDEFDPELGEEYEVTPQNELVRKIN